VAAVLATLDMPPTGQARGLKAHERGRAALLDRRHDLELTEAYMPGIGATPVGSMAMKDVCDPPASGGARPPGYPSGRGLSCINSASRSSGLVTVRMVVLATRV
jgi:hypothetical protein